MATRRNQEEGNISVFQVITDHTTNARNNKKAKIEFPPLDNDLIWLMDWCLRDVKHSAESVQLFSLVYISVPSAAHTSSQTGQP